MIHDTVKMTFIVQNRIDHRQGSVNGKKVDILN